MLRLYAAANLPEAYLLVEQLYAAQIRAHVFNQNAQGAVGELPFTHAYPEIWIERDCDLERAKVIIDRYETAASVEGESDCPKCGEVNPATFQTCWSCDAML